MVEAVVEVELTKTAVESDHNHYEVFAPRCPSTDAAAAGTVAPAAAASVAVAAEEEDNSPAAVVEEQSIRQRRIRYPSPASARSARRRH